MGTKSDFYIMNHHGKMYWLGSGFRDGMPMNLPIMLLIQANKQMFEQEVVEYLENNDGVVRFNGDGWPWPWADSRMTDYTYIFHMCTGKVLMCESGSRPVDVLKILQGMDMIGADVGMGNITFPVMRKESLQQQNELMEEYGPKSAETV